MSENDAYPKSLVHPQHEPSRSYKVADQSGPATGSRIGGTYGTAQRFPPVTVMNQVQEAHHRAMGYREFGEEAPMAAFSEYPLIMTHPDFAEPVPEQTVHYADPQTGQVTFHAIAGKPGRLPPVTVHSPAEEAAQAGKGYARPGRSDPAAVERSSAAPHDPAHVFREYPKLVDGKIVTDPNGPDPLAPQRYPMFVRGETMASEEAHRERWPDDFAPAPPPAPPPENPEVARLRAMNERMAAEMAEMKEQMAALLAPPKPKGKAKPAEAA